MTKAIIVGYKGRMGQAMLNCAARMPELQIIGKVDEGDDIAPLLPQADVVIEFSFHSVTANIAKLCAQHRKALVIGTTGHSETEVASIRAILKDVPTVWASNYSTGVNALFWLTRKAVEIMGPDYDLEVIEMHHRFKKDAPSGTAASLAKILQEARQGSTLRHGREGITGERPPTEIGMHSLRGGDVMGDHTVMFAGLGERLELTHKVSSRDTLANGALRAALWVVAQRPGIYDMQDVLGLK